ncbi:MAG: response regulator [Leptolyngbyaceae cyanobacterium]
MIMLAFLKSAVIPNPVTASPETPVAEVFKRLSTPDSGATTQPQNHWYADICVSCAVILEHGRVAGIVTKQEMMALQLGQGTDAAVANGPQPSALGLDQPVRNIMVPPAVTLHSWECTDIGKLMALLQRPDICCLPIVDVKGQFLGLMSRASLSYAALQQVVHQEEGLGLRQPDASTPIPHPHQPSTVDPAETWALEQDFAARITELETRADWEKVLTDLTAQIRSSLDIQTILDTTVEQVQQVLGCDRVTIWQFDSDDSAIAVAEAMNQPPHPSATDPSAPSPSTPGPSATMPTRISLLGQRIDTSHLNLAQPEPTPNIHTSQFSDYYPDPLVHLQSQDKLLVPLFCDDQLWGLFQVNGRHQHNLWHYKDVELLQFLSIQLAIALQHATIHQQLQIELEERCQAQAHQRETANALYQLNRTLEARVAERTLALQERESRYRALIEVMPDLMIRIHADGTYLDVVAGQETQPFNPNQFRPGVNIYAVTPADHARTRMTHVHNALATEKVQFSEDEMIVNGQLLIEETRVVAINDQEALVIARDITARKRAETQLQKLIEGTAAATGQDFFPVLAQHLAEALDVSYAIVAELVDGQLQTLAVWGMDPFSPLCPPSVQETPCLRSLQEGMFSCESGVQQLFPRDTGLVVLSVDSYLGIALHNSQGEAIGNLCILDQQPIRAPQRAEQILRVFAARAAAELERQRARTALEQLNQALEAKVMARTAELQEREARYRSLNAELIRATRLKDEFLANMSHELRTPLNAILGMAEGLQEGVFGALSSRQIEALQTIERGGQHLLQLINDILDVAKIEAGHLTLELAPVAIAPLCNSSLTFIKQQALKKRIQLETQLPANLPNIHLDERRIRQVLINLLNNAVKFTPEGGRITLAVTLEEKAEDGGRKAEDGGRRAEDGGRRAEGGGRRTEGERQKAEDRRQKAENYLQNPKSEVQNFPTPPLPHLQFSITDTGIGIAPEHLDRLFQPFVQIDGALNRQYAGTGLGLSLVKRIVELHQGTVTVRSEVGVGSCFTITLPYTEWVPPVSGNRPKTVERPAEPATYEPATILIVEDNDANVRTVSSYLQARGYHVQVANNGKEALELVQNQPPDLILMDIQMPDMDGLETIAHIRQHPTTAAIPIIALTALAMAGDRDRCLAAGANEYLSKPVKLRQLASAIQQHLSPTSEKGIPNHHEQA